MCTSTTACTRVVVYRASRAACPCQQGAVSNQRSLHRVLGVPRLPALGPIYGQPGETAAFVDDAATVVGRAGLYLEVGSLGAGATGAGHRNDDVEEIFVEQPLDHFDRQNSRTFSQRYFINKRYIYLRL